MHHYLFTLALLAAASAAQADVCRVTDVGNAGDDGSAWGRATTLVAALERPACTEIWLQVGTYKTPAPAPFNIDRNVRLYGGFRGDESSRAARSTTDPDRTRLDGQGLSRVLQFSAAQVSTGLVDTVLDALSIRNGNDAYGAGMVCQGSHANRECSPTLHNVQLVDNVAYSNGAALYVVAYNGGTARPTLTQVAFINNRTTGSTGDDGGGAVYIGAWQGGIASPHFKQVTFRGNRTRSTGGAVRLEAREAGSTAPRFEDALFDGNETGAMGSAFYGELQGGSASPQFERTSFVNNTVRFYGGTVALFARGSQSSGQLLLRNVTLDGNMGNDVGALVLHGQDGAAVQARLQHLTLTRNTTNNRTGALLALGVDVEMDSSIVWDHTGGSGEPVIAGPVRVRTSLLQAGTCGNFGVVCDSATQVAEGQNPLLAPLADNGGYAPTRLPEANAVVDQADCRASIDQRSVTRPQGAGCDMGAVEVRAAVNYTLTAQVTGSGSVAITPAPVGAAGIANCTAGGGTCTAIYAGDGSDPASVTASATPQVDMPFVTWSGACTAIPGNPLLATVTLDSDKSCNATFATAPGGGPSGATAVPATSFWSLMLLAMLAVWLGAARLRTCVHGADNSARRKP